MLLYMQKRPVLACFFIFLHRFPRLPHNQFDFFKISTKSMYFNLAADRGVKAETNCPLLDSLGHR